MASVSDSRSIDVCSPSFQPRSAPALPVETAQSKSLMNPPEGEPQRSAMRKDLKPGTPLEFAIIAVECCRQGSSVFAGCVGGAQFCTLGILNWREMILRCRKLMAVEGGVLAIGRDDAVLNADAPWFGNRPQKNSAHQRKSPALSSRILITSIMKSSFIGAPLLSSV